MLTLEGTIEDIIFRNEVNTYTIARIDTSDGPATIVGYIPFIDVGETVKVEGDWIYHPTYGEQLEISTISIVVPSTRDGIEKYLASGLIPNIGPKTAKKIVRKFGLETFDVIRDQPEKLKEISGIGDKTLEKIIEAYADQGELRDIMVFLQQYGITANYGMKIYRTYGPDTIAIISENPYRLSEDIFGIGFVTADKIAKNMGINHESPYRIEAGIRFTINKYGISGHTYVPKTELIPSTAKILDVDINLIEGSIRDLAIKGIIHILNKDEELLVYNTPFHIAENNVSRKIVELSRVELDSVETDLDRAIKTIEGEDGLNFATKQIEAIEESMGNGIVVITGGPGTGKTTIINAIIKIIEDQGLSVTLAAPTGRAAKRMTETTGIEAKTIHRLLEYTYMEEGMAFGIDEGSPLETDLLIIDEASMIDILLMNSLLKAVTPGTRLVLVGDVDQLPSVGAGNVLNDIIESEAVKVVELDEIFRQAEESMIVVNAHMINKGEFPQLNKKGKDFFFIHEREGDKIVQIIIDLCKNRLPNYYQVDPLKDIQVLTPMKKGDVGINILNKELQKYLNPEAFGKKEKTIGDDLFRVGDKVMQIKNNYTTEWEVRENGMLIEKGEGIYNGDYGIILDIEEDGKSMKILFDDEKEVEYSFSQLDELKLSYATTVHKSQGSEFPVVIMPISWGPPMLLTRNLLYTAITRARTLVVLVGETRYLRAMIRNNRITERYSTLDYKIKNMTKLF